MLTILTSFKPFVAADASRQINALASWKALSPELEIVAFGETQGIAPLINEFGICHIPEIASCEGRLPRIDAIFEFARAHSQYDLQVYVNGDILLFDDFVTALKSIQLPRFVMIGQRLDVDIRQRLDFSDKSRREELKEQFIATGQVHDVGGIDYFACRRGSLPLLPPLYVGAAGWDNIVIYSCRRAQVPVIDATLDVRAFHQTHEYQLSEDGKSSVYHGPAARANLAHVDSRLSLFYTTDASHWLDGGRLKGALLSPRHAWRMILTYPIIRGWGNLPRWFFQTCAAVVRRIGLVWLRLFWSKEKRQIIGLWP